MDPWGFLKTAAIIVGVVVLAIAAFVVITLINIWLWENALAPVTGFQTPDFLQMIGIEILCYLLVYPAASSGGRASNGDVERARDKVLSEIRELRDVITRARAYSQ